MAQNLVMTFLRKEIKPIGSLLLFIHNLISMLIYFETANNILTKPFFSYLHGNTHSILGAWRDKCIFHAGVRKNSICITRENLIIQPILLPAQVAISTRYELFCSSFFLPRCVICHTTSFLMT